MKRIICMAVAIVISSMMSVAFAGRDERGGTEWRDDRGHHDGADTMMAMGIDTVATASAPTKDDTN